MNARPLAPHEVIAAAPHGLMDALHYPLFQSVFDRKSRRVALGMSVESDVLEFTSRYEPVPLSELEEARIMAPSCSFRMTTVCTCSTCSASSRSRMK